MEAAGRAVARAVMARYRPCPTLVLAGPGNNGGDGYVVARRLREIGWPVTLAALAPPRPGTDAALVAPRWLGPTAPFAAAEAARAGLVIDAVLGAGLSRALPDSVAEVLGAAPRVVAVDVPSGLDGATGEMRGRVRAAELTVTFFRRKPGHLLFPGRALCGVVTLTDIGMPPAVLDAIQPDHFANAPGLWRLPALDHASHKYTRGHVTILGGEHMTGAARLAADAARRAGAGLLTIACSDAAAPTYRAGAPGALVTEAPIAALLEDPRRTVWICGPGLGTPAARAALAALRGAERIVVGDADVFSAAAEEPDALRGCAVLTPHAGEFARVFGPPGPDRLAAARKAAERTGAVMLLKGADTIIAAPDGRVAINENAPPWLATAGSGDVLAGLIGGLLAQAMPAWEAACAGAWLHGRAASVAGAGMLAEDLAPALPRAWADAIRGCAPV
jgi:hydroxyethylthiazole kinase-like uncharacterized protein yjeF